MARQELQRLAANIHAVLNQPFATSDEHLCPGTKGLTTPDERMRVAIVHADEPGRVRLRSLLARHGDVEVVVECSTAFRPSHQSMIHKRNASEDSDNLITDVE